MRLEVGKGGMQLTTSSSGRMADGKLLVAHAWSDAGTQGVPHVREKEDGKREDDESPSVKAKVEDDECSTEDDTVDFTNVDDTEWDNAEFPTLALPMGVLAPSSGALELPMETLIPPVCDPAPQTGVRGFRGLGAPGTLDEFVLVSRGQRLSHSALEE